MRSYFEAKINNEHTKGKIFFRGLEGFYYTPMPKH